MRWASAALAAVGLVLSAEISEAATYSFTGMVDAARRARAAIPDRRYAAIPLDDRYVTDRDDFFRFDVLQRTIALRAV
jgi:hypothetical protein